MNNTTKTFLHHLRNTVLLTSGEIQIANLLENLDNISDQDVEKVKQLNINLIDSIKAKLANISTIKISTDLQ